MSHGQASAYPPYNIDTGVMNDPSSFYNVLHSSIIAQRIDQFVPASVATPDSMDPVMDLDPLKIASINTHSSASIKHSAVFEAQFVNHHFDVVGMQESRDKPSGIYVANSFIKVSSQGTPQRTHGCRVYISRDTVWGKYNGKAVRPTRKHVRILRSDPTRLIVQL